MKHLKLSKTSLLHCFKLVFRSILFISAVILYIIYKDTVADDPFGGFEDNPILLGVITLVFLVEMILRLFPSKIESMGCQKQFKKNYIDIPNIKTTGSGKGVIAVAAIWIALNGIIAALYYCRIIDEGMLLLISLFYSVCDLICILFFCPFQQWVMKNKCCGTCRIYNWDYFMMFTPLIFIRSVFAYILVFFSVVLLIRWEITALIYPRRFSEATNKALCCKNCNERLCAHKTALKAFLFKNSHLRKPHN